MTYKYNLVALGGTFDRFHKGHESLLRTAFENGKRVIIGLTTEEMVKGKVLAPIIDSYEVRKKAVGDFLEQNHFGNRYELVPLTDELGPARHRSDIEAIVVGPRFSQKAIEQIKHRVVLIHCPVVYTEKRSYLSSTAIRQGDVNRKGALYQFPNHTLLLSSETRDFLKIPLGKFVKKILANFKKPLVLITVGDETTRAFTELNMIPDLAIVDFQVQRKKKYSSVDELGLSVKAVTTVRCPAGTLTPSIARSIKRAIKRSVESKKSEVIRVIGEEDLATLLCILFAPLTSVVCYGQPNEGLVMVEVTEEKKDEIAKLLESFTPLPPSATMK